MKKVIIILAAAAFITSCGEYIDLQSGIGAPDNNAYEGTNYVFHRAAGKHLGKSTRGVNVYAIKGDTENNFLYEWGDNTDCYVKKGYEIPQSGTVTAVFTYNVKLTEKQNEIYAFMKIAKNEGEKYTVSIENLTRDAKDFYFAYEGCLVTNNLVGYIAYIDDKWLFITARDVGNFNAPLDFTNDEDRKLLGTFKGVASLITDETIIKMLEKNRNLRKLRPTSFLSKNTYKSQAFPQNDSLTVNH
jgi:hypothetical protein